MVNIPNEQHSFRGAAALQRLSKRTFRRKPCWLAITLPLALSTTAVHAQSQSQSQSQPQPQTQQQPQARSGPVLEEVMVTASRRTESVQMTAASITAMSAADLSKQGITTFEGVERVAAGLQLDAGNGSTSATVRIRGVGSQPFSGTDPSVGVLVDGVYVPSPGFVFTELMDIERVEVLRGPQGTLFGKNTTAGVISIHTKDPELDALSGKVQAKAGNYDNAELRGTINIPLIEDRLAIRLSAFSAEHDGFGKNRLTGDDTFSMDRSGGRVKALWQVTDNFQALWSSEYSETETRNDQGLVSYGSLDARGAGALHGAPLEQVGDFLGKPLPPLDRHNRRVWQEQSRTEDTIERHTLTLRASGLNHTFSSLTSYEESENYYPQDSDGTLLDLSGTISNPKRRTTSQEFQIASDWQGDVEYIAGAFLQKEIINSPTQALDGADLAFLENRAQRAPTIIETERDDETQALFGNLTYHLTPDLSVTGGVRWTKVERFTNQTIGPFPVINGAEEEYREWTYSGKIRYNIDPSKMVYVAIDRGFKAGGFNRQNTGCFLGAGSSCLSPDQLVYEPETTDSIELGWKTEWLDRRLRLNGAVFYQVYDDFHVTTTIPDTSSNIVTNAAKVESHGLELDLIALPTENLSVELHAAWVKTEYDTFESAPCSALVSRSLTCIQDLTGKRLDNAPELSLNAGAEYRAPMPIDNTALEWFARVDASYRSSANLMPTLDADTEQGGYTRLGMRFGLEPTDGQWRVTLWGDNLLDKEYLTQSYRAANHEGLRVVHGAPRTYGVTLDWNF